MYQSVSKPLAIAASAFALCGPAFAENYVAISGGIAFQEDSENAGVFDGDFITGAGTTIPAGTVLPDGTAVGWNTGFDNGYLINLAFGRRYNIFRGEIEVSYQNAQVDTHTDVVAGGIALGAEDAGVLVTGADNLGISVADLVADGQGELESVYGFANAYVDIPTGFILEPYVGGGVGLAFKDVNYSPSATTIIDDSDTSFAWQVMAGVTAEITPRIEVFGGYRFRDGGSLSVAADLFDADFDIENRASIVEAGIRANF